MFLTLFYVSCSQPGAILTFWEHYSMSRDIIGCYKWGGGATGVRGPLGIEARDAAEHPAMYRTAPPEHRASHPNASILLRLGTSALDEQTEILLSWS